MLKFSYNWNNKLSCKYFSTIRLFSQKFQIGNFYTMDYRGSRCKVECVYKQPIKLKDIPDCIFFLDTGYDKDTSINIFRTMYKNGSVLGEGWALAVLNFKFKTNDYRKH